MTKRIDPTGVSFAHLTAVRFVDNRNSKEYWAFQCICGKEIVRQKSAVMRGDIRSCGCVRGAEIRARKLAHGNCPHGKPTREYKSWAAMIQRCDNPNCSAYRHYGGRGIQVCDRWRSDFANFLADMGPKPSARHTIDRLEANGHYEPDNCRWATAKEQARNRRDAITVHLNGKDMPLMDAAEALGINYATLRTRMKRGIPLDRPIGRWAK